MAVLQYKKGDTKRIRNHFRVSEFACHGKNCCDTVLVDEALAEILQQIRDHFGKPVMVNSGYRCPAHNQAVGGAAASFHTRGMAADIAVQDVAPAEVARVAERMGVAGIGLYETDRDGYFVHLDTRSVPAFWYGQAQKPRLSFGGFAYGDFLAELAQALGTDDVLGQAPTLGEKFQQRHPAVKPVQKYLAALGDEEVGVADGIAGAKFATAVAHFQQDHGLVPTGILEQWGRSWHTLLQMGWGGSV